MTNPVEFTGQTFRAQEDRTRYFIEIICRYVDSTQPLRILDIGCGTGTLLVELLKILPLASGTGVDISEANIQAANDCCRQLGWEERLTFVTSDYMEFCVQPVDLIVTYSTLQHISTPTELLFSKIANDLTPQGRLINCMPYECFYNQCLYGIRRLLRILRSPLTDVMLLTVAKTLHGHQMTKAMLQERVVYLYTLPERCDSVSLRQFLYTHCGLVFIAEHFEHHRSIGQPKHCTTVFQKQSST